MVVTNWLRGIRSKLTISQNARHKRQRGLARFGLEVLEARTLLSASDVFM